MTKFNLSEKIVYGLRQNKDDYDNVVTSQNFQSIDLADVKEFIRLLKEEFFICRDKTDIWADEERWNKFEKMFKKKLKGLAGEKLI